MPLTPNDTKTQDWQEQAFESLERRMTLAPDARSAENAILASEVGVVELLVTFVRDEDGVVIAECPSIPGCISQGRDRDEAERNIRDAIHECLEVRRAQGLPLTLDTTIVDIPA